MNTAALKAAKIDANTKAPEGGQDRGDTQGNPTGLLRESAMALVGDLLPDYPDNQVDTGLAKAQDEAYSYGITAIIDPSAKEWMLRGYKRFDDAGKLKMRVKAAVEIDAEEGPAASAGARTKEPLRLPASRGEFGKIVRRRRHRDRHCRAARSLCRLRIRPANCCSSRSR